ncbi:esterase-like activity of phytase family protein [Salegentibacter sp. F188]|uniref:Esterase-like activity of phytase family protein n=1 Tax=Autumnicola patrickiae TaxID=3075591 RepID=A0ABU3DXN2_9FLAO|nr:esterase-like activity of phytase family protein [Salegentibacter sp. F188]MDT0688458.1 esterase-like activity of phytase family protein [Salegentibacter sp. F188]
MRRLAGLAFALLFLSCATTRRINNDGVTLKFLDDYVLDADLKFDNTKVGGLSGIDFSNGKYYIVCDQPSNPRFYIADIKLNGFAIDTMTIEDVVRIKKPEGIEDRYLDMESIRFQDENNMVVISTEGRIVDEKDPGIFRFSIDGEFIEEFAIPDHFSASGEQKPRNNGVFEGLSKSADAQGYWVATELPLKKDGPKPKLFPTTSPVRFTLFNSEEKTAVKQFVYKLDGVSKIPFLYFAINGITEILEYDKDKFLVLERSFSAGHGTNSNTVKIFAVDAGEATNTLEMDRLRKSDYKFAEKQLIFNFKSVKKQFSEEIIDNIEGMCFGPVLPNGNRSLILISDNNFNSYGKQISQVILLEVEELN